MAISTYNAKLKYGATTASTEVAIKSFPQILGKRNALETTTMSDDSQTYIKGIRQAEGSFDFTCNYDKTIYNTINSLSAEQSCELSFSDGSKFTWTGDLSVAISEGSVDSVMEMVISAFPSTVPVFSAGT